MTSGRSEAMHVAKVVRPYKDRVYTYHFLRQTYREGRSVKHRTLANLSHLPPELIELVRRSLKGVRFVAAADALRIVRSLPHGHIAAVLGLVRRLGLETQVAKVRDRFGLSDIVLVGDRGMLTSARIERLRELGGIGWVSCLRTPAIRALVEAGDLQLSLFDETNLAEITSPEFPGERLVVCRNPLLAAERARKRE